jgi:hypothetical protein
MLPYGSGRRCGLRPPLGFGPGANRPLKLRKKTKRENERYKQSIVQRQKRDNYMMPSSLNIRTRHKKNCDLGEASRLSLEGKEGTDYKTDTKCEDGKKLADQEAKLVTLDRS